VITESLLIVVDQILHLSRFFLKESALFSFFKEDLIEELVFLDASIVFEDLSGVI